MLTDSGVPRGSDILKLLLAEADAVMLGRAMLYVSAAGGTEGAVRMVELLSAELSAAMSFAPLTARQDCAGPNRQHGPI